MLSYSRLEFVTEERQVDRGVISGLSLSFVLLAIAILASGQILNFLSIPAVLVVFGGTFGATLVNYSMPELRHAWESMRMSLTSASVDPIERIRYLVRLSQEVRQDGVLILEREAGMTEDGFLKKAFELAADGQQADEIRRILETEAMTATERSMKTVQVFQSMGQFAPAMGLIGTLVGLIEMLGALDKPSMIGPSMAVALVTTLYGAVFANLVLLPLAGKLRNRAAEDNLVKALTIEGVASLSKQESPIVVQQRLQSFLPQSPGRYDA